MTVTRQRQKNEWFVDWQPHTMKTAVSGLIAGNGRY
jgi:hypothetical protein